MVFNRVEHVERVEDWEKGLSHKDHKEHKDGFRRWGFTPYPECELIIRDSTLFGVWGDAPKKLCFEGQIRRSRTRRVRKHPQAPALKIYSAYSASLRLCDSALNTTPSNYRI